MAVRTATTGARNWNVNAAWVGGVQPTAADDVILPSGAIITIPTATTVACRSLTVQSGATLVFTNSTSCILNLGDATAGASNVAISISSGATITLGGSAVINMISTSGTQQTIDMGGKILPSINFNGPGSSYILTSNYAVSTSTQWNQGTFNSANYDITGASYNIGGGLTRTITLGSSQVTATAGANGWIFGNLTNLTFTANTATLTITGAGFSTNNLMAASTFNFNGMSVVLTGGGSGALSVLGTTFTNLTIIGTASQSDQYRVIGLGHASN